MSRKKKNITLEYPDVRFDSRPTPRTGMVCDKCSKFFWELICEGRIEFIRRCKCGEKLRLATLDEKIEANKHITFGKKYELPHSRKRKCQE